MEKKKKEIGFIQPPQSSLSSKEQIQTVANQGREGMKKEWRNGQETIVQPWSRILVPPERIYITSLSSSAGTKAPTQMLLCCSVLSYVRLFGTPWTAARQASLSLTISRSLLKLMSIYSVMPSNHIILCHPLLLLPSIVPSSRVFSNE